MTVFSIAFQATVYTTIDQILCYFVDADIIALDDTTKVPFEERSCQLDNNKEVGERAQLLTKISAKMEWDQRLIVFYHVRHSYTTLCQNPNKGISFWL